MKYNNPIPSEIIELFTQRLMLTEDDTILEVGCGEGALLEYIAERYRCGGVALDIDKKATVKARERLNRLNSTIEVVDKAFDEYTFAQDTFSHAICIGSSHAFGGVGEAVEAMFRALSKKIQEGRYLLVGVGYWKQEPPAEYLEKTGLQAEELRSLPELIELASSHGLEAVSMVRASEQDWDLFESFHWHKWSKQNPERDMSTWRNAYIQWGKETMGFVLFLLEKKKG